MIIYKLFNDPITGKTVSVTKDGILSIPLDPDNKDYQQYLAWLAKGNTPEPADEQGAQ